MGASRSTRSALTSLELRTAPLHNLDKPAPGVVEAIELYEAAMRHYALAAAYTDHVSRVSTTSAALAAEFARLEQP